MISRLPNVVPNDQPAHWIIVEDIEFDIGAANAAVEALQEVLARRTHRRKYLGQEVLVPGQLGSALRLPMISAQLKSKTAPRRERGLESFQCLWPTLSPGTQDQVLDMIGWYEPGKLSWEDKRSNRRPPLPRKDQ